MKIKTMPSLPKVDNLVGGREFELYRAVEKVSPGQKTAYLVRRLALAEAALDLVPEVGVVTDDEWQKKWGETYWKWREEAKGAGK